LKDPDQRDNIEATMARLQAKLAEVSQVDTVAKAVQSIQIATTDSPTQYQYVLIDSNRDRLKKWTDRLAETLQSAPELRHVHSNIKDTGQQLFIDINRSEAGRLDVSMQAIDNVLYSAFGQRQISTIYGQANQYRVILEAAPRFQKDPSALEHVYVPSQDGKLI